MKRDQEEVLSLPLGTLTAVSAFSTMTLLFLLLNRSSDNSSSMQEKSTPLPGYGILGDRVNEFIELFLDALAVYVHKSDGDWECGRRMLCEANQRAADGGPGQGLLMYLLSLSLSVFLSGGQKVSESLEAMKLGRLGNDCATLYSKCPLALR